MSRDDALDDEGPRRRRDRWGEDEGEARAGPSQAPTSERSGVVTTAGVITLILGSLVLLAGLCGGGAMIAGTLEMGRGGMMRGGQGAMLLALLVCLVILCWGAGAIASGIGLINRRNWARILTLVLGGFSAVGGGILLFVAGMLWFVPNMGGPEGILILAYLFYLFLGLLFLGHCLWIYLILLSSRYSAEFR